MRTNFRLTIAALALLWAGLASAQSAPIFLDSFNRPDGPITTANSPDWEVTSGAFSVSGGAGAADAPVFRADTKRTDFGDVEVDVKLLNLGVSGAPQSFDGFHMMLRRQSEFHLYYVTVNRNRDNVIVIKKKVPGGPSNGGSYYNLSPTGSFVPPIDRWQDVKATVKNESDGSVTIRLYINGILRATGVDNGVGGAPIRQNGGLGIRGDNLNLKVDEFTVRTLAASGAPSPSPAPAPGAPGSPGQPAPNPAPAAAPERALAPQKFLTPGKGDGINDGAVFGPDAREVDIFDMRGIRVFHGAQLGGAAIRWDGRDGMGAVVPSGVYVAAIKTAAANRMSQSFAVAK